MINADDPSKASAPAPASKKQTASSKAAKGKLPFTVKWEKRKRPSTAFAPSLRSGCTMALWGARGLGVMFGGVTDEDTDEESLRSVFHNDLFVFLVTHLQALLKRKHRHAYQLGLEKGKWSSLLLRKPKVNLYAPKDKRIQ